MKIKVFLTIIGLSLLNLTFGQSQEKYSELKKEAERLYGSKEYQKSANKYKEAFDQIDGISSSNDTYNASCSYALAGDIENAFYHLLILAKNHETKYKNYRHIITDPDLDILHKDKRWNNLIEIVKSNKEEAEKHLDKRLVAVLDTIHQEDQKYRHQINEIEKEFGWKSNEIQAHWKIISKKDSINFIKVEEILNNRGWLGADIIGEQGNNTLFLVIQHSDLETQLKYLPMMREAVIAKNARASSLALLEDRVALGQGNRQIYGSQIHSDKNGKKYVAPLIDPENVDKRRAVVGLGTLADYVGHWNLTWNIEKHKARVAKIESEKEK
jgi:hypothetical protein